MKSYLKIFAPMVVVILLGLLTISFAQTRGGNQTEGRRGFGGPPPMGGGGPGFHPGLLAQLNLTDQQKEQIKTLQDNARTASEANFDKLKTFQDQLNTATTSGSFNEDQVRQILTARSQVLIEMDVVRLRTDAAIYNLLTADQKTQLEQLKQTRFEGRRGGFQPPPPPPSQN